MKKPLSHYKAVRRLYYQNNKIKIKERSRLQRLSNPKGNNTYQKKYRNTPNGLINLYKGKAKYRGIPFFLTKEEGINLLIGNCTYCGDLPNPCNSIDRVDSSLGYTKDNCVSSCWTCNMMKMDLPLEMFISQCKKIIKNLDK